MERLDGTVWASVGKFAASLGFWGGFGSASDRARNSVNDPTYSIAGWTLVSTIGGAQFSRTDAAAFSLTVTDLNAVDGAWQPGAVERAFTLRCSGPTLDVEPSSDLWEPPPTTAIGTSRVSTDPAALAGSLKGNILYLELL